nr:hypothetical protein [Clostridium neonatale]
MHVYMISYDLNKPGQNYSKVHEDIESLGVWCHYLDSTYLVKSYYSIFDAEKIVTQHLDSSDKLIICEIDKPVRGWLSNDNWNWIHSNL